MIEKKCIDFEVRELRKLINAHGTTSIRRKNCYKELSHHMIFIEGDTVNFDLSKVESNSEHFLKELEVYKKMSTPSFKKLREIFIDDCFSRRLIIQFPWDWHYNRNENMSPCIESIIMTLNEENECQVLAQFRSSDIDRLNDDILIIIERCRSFFKFCRAKVKITSLSLCFANVHKII